MISQDPTSWSSINFWSCWTNLPIDSSVPGITVVMRESPSFSAGPTARLYAYEENNHLIKVMKTKYKNTSTFQCQLTWILYPLRDIAPVTMLRTTGRSLTIIDKVCDWIPLDWNIKRRPKICIVMTLLFKSYNSVIKWHCFDELIKTIRFRI